MSKLFLVALENRDVEGNHTRVSKPEANNDVFRAISWHASVDRKFLADIGRGLRLKRLMAAVLECTAQFHSVSVSSPPRPRVQRKDDFDVRNCILEVRDGNEVAARALMERLYPLVLRLVRAYLPRRTAEEDLVQTVFIKIFSRLHQYAGLVPIERWVCRIAVNTCLNELKREKIRPEWRFSDLSEAQQRLLEQLPGRDESLATTGALAGEVVVRLLRLLKPAERLVIQLLHMEQKTVLEISNITGWSVPMIKVRAFRARNKLKKLLRNMEPAMKASI